MNTHFFLLGWLTLAACLRASEVPNVVYIIADDQSYRDFGFMGSQEALTPNIDRLAAGSTRFVNGYVPTPLCSPSLAALLTGRYPHQSGLHYNHPPPGNGGFNKMQSPAEYVAARSPAFAIIRGLPTLPRVLGEHGFVSLQTGKFWEGHFSNAGFTQGMTIFKAAPHLNYPGVNRTLQNGQLAAHGNGDHGLAIGRETLQPIADFLGTTAREKPFFIWYAPYLPHQPHDSPRRFFDLYRGRGVAEHRIPYLASVSQFDETVGQLTTMLVQRNLLANTLIVFVVDNGWTPSTAPDPRRPQEYSPIRKSKYSPFEEGLRTPILLSWPGHTRAESRDELVSSVDLFPTVLEAIGQGDAVRGLPGRSLWQAATSGVALPPRPVFGEVYPGDASSLGHPSRDIAYRWIRDGDFKLIVPHTHDRESAWRDYVERRALFNVTEDPSETRDIAEDDPRQVAFLQNKLDAWWTPAKDATLKGSAEKLKSDSHRQPDR